VQDGVALGGEDFVAFFVSTRMLVMHRPIYLNHEFVLCTVEVSYETTDGMLPAEFEAQKLTAAKVLPEQDLGRCLLLSQLSSAFTYVSLGADRLAFGHGGVWSAGGPHLPPQPPPSPIS
jgi:hypothetical protein